MNAPRLHRLLSPMLLVHVDFTARAAFPPVVTTVVAVGRSSIAGKTGTGFGEIGSRADKLDRTAQRLPEDSAVCRHKMTAERLQ